LDNYIIRRIFGSFLVFLTASLLIFTLVRLSPGDPVDVLYGPTRFGESQSGISPEAKEAIRRDLGLDRPFIIQYGIWLQRAAHLDFGLSFRTRRPVTEELFHRLPATIYLALLAFTIEIITAIPLGLLSALYANRPWDHIIRMGAVVLRALPPFWIGLMALFVFAVKLQWIAVVGDASLRQIILPALILGLLAAPRIMRILRAGMLQELSSLYYVFGRIKGLSCHRLILYHAFRNGLLPVVTLLGMSLGSLLSGSIIIETIFSWPGIGKYLVESIASRDYPVIQAYVMLTTFGVIFINLLVDISYSFLDPRVRLGEQNGKR